MGHASYIFELAGTASHAHQSWCAHWGKWDRPGTLGNLGNNNAVNFKGGGARYEAGWWREECPGWADLGVYCRWGVSTSGSVGGTHVLEMFWHVQAASARWRARQPLWGWRGEGCVHGDAAAVFSRLRCANSILYRPPVPQSGLRHGECSCSAVALDCIARQ